MENSISKRILKLINSAKEPLETREIEKKLKGVSRAKILYRLNLLRAENKIKAKSVGAGKGNWIWWKNDAFK
jgi:predicted transcriptional regulator